MAERKTNRREWMKSSASLLAAGSLAPSLWAGASDSDSSSTATDVPHRAFGPTKEKVSMLALGGHHIGRIRDDQEAIDFVRKAVDMGVTFMDNAWEYHNGRSEEIMGRALEGGRRKQAFLMTKHHGRDKKTAMQHLEDSLRRLKTDVIDLWQFHEVVYEDDPNMIFAPEGGIEAAELAKKQGKVRFIGFTGHKDPNIHLEMLAWGYPFDAVQMPINPLDHHFRSFEKEVLPVLRKRNIGVIAMKTIAAGNLLRTGVTPEQALRYAWSQPVDTIVSGMDNEQMLRENVSTARAFKPMSQQEQAALLESVKQYAQSGEYEPFKTTRRFDGRVGRELHGIS